MPEDKMTDQTTFNKYLEDPERRRIFEQERLLVDATELLARVMEMSGTKRADLANKLGRSKSYVTQMLRGNQNLTLKTLADVFCVLNYRLLMVADPFVAGMGVVTSRQWNMTQQGTAVVKNQEAPLYELFGEHAA
jgi:antitoxin component HigA of HigAB toxin-antitoxin module